MRRAAVLARRRPEDGRGLPAWAGGYVGIPFRQDGRDRDGCDCWGLVRLVLAERFGADLPSYAGLCVDVEEAAEAAAAFAHGLAQGGWGRVDGLVRAGDVGLFRRRGVPAHVGVLIGPRHFLHVERGLHACVGDLLETRWEHGLEGVYRHVLTERAGP